MFAATSTTTAWSRTCSRSGNTSRCSPTSGWCCSSSGSICPRQRRKSGSKRSRAIRARGGAWRARAWGGTRADWEAYRIYSRSHPLWEHLLRETSTGVAPWYVVEGANEHYRYLTVGKILLDALRSTLAHRPALPKHAVAPPPPSAVDNVKLIRDLDFSQN